MTAPLIGIPTIVTAVGAIPATPQYLNLSVILDPTSFREGYIASRGCARTILGDKVFEDCKRREWGEKK